MQTLYRSMRSSQARISSPFKQYVKPAYPLLLAKLREANPSDTAELIYTSPFECLVGAILLTQSSIEEVNKITPSLFEKYPTVDAMAGANRRDLERIIRVMGFYRQKAKQLPMMCQMLVSNYGGEVPQDLMSLTRLPGVARKTANLVMAELYGRTEGIVVDMRVRRVVSRLELASGKSAEAVEKQLMTIVPRSDWIELPQLLMELGDATCTVKHPGCVRCPLKNLCPTAKSHENQDAQLH